MNPYERSEIFGRRTRLAIACDAILYGAILWTAIAFLTRNTGFSVAVATLWTAAAEIVLLCWLKQRAKREREKLFERVRTELVLERLLLMPWSQAENLLYPDGLLQKTVVRSDDLIAELQNGVTTVWICGDMEAAAESFLKRHPDKMTVHRKEETAKRFFLTVSDDEVRRELDARSRRKRKLPQLHELVRQWKPNRFTLLGTLLMGLSFLTRYQIYFRILASGCYLVGSVLYTRSVAQRAGQNQSR